MRNVLLMLVVAATLGSAHAEETYWTNGAFTGNWSDANNWDNGLPDVGDDTIIQNLTALTWPRLDGGVGQCKQLRIAYDPNMLGELTVTGGAILQVHGDLRIARRTPGGQTGTLYVSDLGTCIIGSEDIEVGRWGDATIDISGGYLCTAGNGYLNLAYHTPSFGTIYLRSGTIEVGTGGLTVGANQSDIGTALIDIYDGVLIIAGDAVSDVNTYVDDGVIIAFGGERDVLVEFDGNRTVVRAYPGINMPPSVDVPGGFERIDWPDSNSIRLDANVTDDDPCGLGPPILSWSVLSGPAEADVVFHPSDDIQDPCAIFSAPGLYELLLRVRDSGTYESAPLEAIGLATIVVEESHSITSDGSFIVTRLNNKEPIIDQDMFEVVGVGSEGANINGPSLLRIPDWIATENRADPCAVYYLYFAKHTGDYIRMAWGVDLEGPWHLYNISSDVPHDSRGVLSFKNDKIDIGNDITVKSHIASPDVFADDVNERIVMYFHGPSEQGGSSTGQSSFVATSPYGLDFNGRIEPVILGGSYFRVFEHGGNMYAFDNAADLYRAPDANAPWTPPPGFDFGDDLWDMSSNDPFADDLTEAGFDGMLRHTAVRLIGDTLQVFYTRKYDDRPERILMSTIDLGVGDYDLWDSSYPPEEILQAQPGWEGGQFLPIPSEGGSAPENVNQLRDPYVFEDIDGKLYLFYAGCGEDAIGLAGLQPVALGDFEPDGDVDFTDLAHITSFWLTNEPSVDIGGPGHQADGIINLFDFAIITENWTGSMD